MKTSRTISFDGWVLRADIGELAKDGRRIRLQQRPLLVLEELLAHPGELVTREQLIARLWPKGVIDFDTGLNTAVRKLRVALDDVGDVPRYIETLPRKGYRFVGVIDPLPAGQSVAPSVAEVARSADVPVAAATAAPVAAPSPAGAPPPQSRHGMRYFLPAALALAAAGLIALYVLRDAITASPVPTSAVIARPLEDRPAIAVLQLASASDAQDETLAQVVGDVLLERVGKLPDATVIGAISLPRATRDAEELRRIGSSLKARFVLDGTVSRRRDQLALALHLVESGSGARLWSFEGERPESELASLAEQVAQGVARHLGIRAQPGAGPMVAHPLVLEAYGTYLRAQQLMKTQRVADTLAALELFRRATVLDSGLARAYVGMAQALIASTSLGGSTTAEQDAAEREAQVALERALALDPGLGEVYIERARLTGDPAAADQLYRQGLSLSPNYGQGYQRYAEFLHDEYRRGEALEAIERAHALDPLDPRVTVRLAMYHYLADGDAEQHDRLIREALAINPKLVLGLLQLGLSRYLNSGEFADGIRLLEQAIDIDPHSDYLKNFIVGMYLDVDDPAAARAVLALSGGMPSASVEVALYRRERQRAAQLARAIPLDDWRTRWGTPEAWALRDEAIDRGDFSLARQRLEERYALAVPWGPSKTAGPREWNRTLGLVYADTLVRAGETQRGRKLAQTILAQIDGESVGRLPFHMSRDRAAALAILGDREGAIEELGNSLGIGHYSHWWYYGELDPIFENVRADPRFQALVTRARQHRARQREVLEELRRTGQVPKR